MFVDIQSWPTSRDPNKWYRKPGWNFAHRVDPLIWQTLCRRPIPITADEKSFEDYGADPETDPVCTICSAILGREAL